MYLKIVKDFLISVFSPFFQLDNPRFEMIVSKTFFVRRPLGSPIDIQVSHY